MMACLEDQLHALRHQLLDMARHLKGLSCPAFSGQGIYG
jgi:hypothetical protein